MQLDSGTRLFLYQLVGTWGQLLFPKPWKEFRLWYDDHKAKGIKPFLDGMVRFLFFYIFWVILISILGYHLSLVLHEYNMEFIFR